MIIFLVFQFSVSDKTKFVRMEFVSTKKLKQFRLFAASTSIGKISRYLKMLTAASVPPLKSEHKQEITGKAVFGATKN